MSSDGGVLHGRFFLPFPKVRKGRKSAIAGRGLFATEIQIADNLHLAATTPEERDAVMLVLNHSCEPNVGFAGNIVLVTMADIAAGEEVTVDYAMFDIIGGAMACACGRSRCRGTVTGDDWRLPVLQERYRGYFSWYLQRRIEDGG